MGIAERRQLLGRRIKRARQRAGFASQQKFADHIGVDKSSVAHAESGSDRIAIGGRSFAAIEDGLGWPEDCITRYLQTGDESVFTSPSQPTPEPEPVDPATELLLQAYDLWRADGLSHDEAMAKIEIQKLRLEKRRREARTPSPGQVGGISPAG